MRTEEEIDALVADQLGQDRLCVEKLADP